MKLFFVYITTETTKLIHSNIFYFEDNGIADAEESSGLMFCCFFFFLFKIPAQLQS